VWTFLALSLSPVAKRGASRGLEDFAAFALFCMSCLSAQKINFAEENHSLHSPFMHYLQTPVF
jgi:hypothetical protein